MAEGEQEAAAGLAGTGVNLRFQRPPKSRAPILLSIHQMEEPDTALCVKERRPDFTAINKHGAPLSKTEEGRPAISLKDWPKKERPKQCHQLRRVRSTSGPRRRKR
eukprot:4870227-Pyramimonas_sp.AAC.1